MQIKRTLIRGMAILCVALAYAEQSPIGANERAGRYPDCESTCNAQASCGTQCEYPAGDIWVFTTCEEYDGGYDNYRCDLGTWDSCNACPDIGLVDDPCYADGSETTCGNYGGDYAYCGDGFCLDRGGETPDTCPSDCGEVVMEPPDDQTAVDAWYEAFQEIEAAWTGNDDADAYTIAETMYAYGLIDWSTKEQLLGFDDEDPPAPSAACLDPDALEDASPETVSLCEMYAFDSCWRKAAKKAAAAGGFAIVSGGLAAAAGATAALPPVSWFFAAQSATVGFVAGRYGGAAVDQAITCTTGWSLPWNE